MSAKKMHKIDEFVDSDGGMIRGNDRNPTSDSEIETGPTPKTWDDDSDYEKGMATTTDRATRYRQDIPWFAVYSYGNSSGRNLPLDTRVPPISPDSDSNSTVLSYEDDEDQMNERKKVLTKNQIEEDIKEDLVKKSKDKEVWSKDYDAKTEKIVDTIEDGDLTDNQLERIKKAVLDRMKKRDA